MKATVVPAQVTTVEDRVAGNLGFSQLILFAIPVFGGSLLFAALPPNMGVAAYKLIIIGLLGFLCLTMAIRIKGKILLLWMITLGRYHARPRLYLFNKNTSSCRELYDRPLPANEPTIYQDVPIRSSVRLPKLKLYEASAAYATIDDPLSKVRFETTKKGGLHVHLTEIKE